MGRLQEGLTSKEASLEKPESAAMEPMSTRASARTAASSAAEDTRASPAHETAAAVDAPAPAMAKPSALSPLRSWCRVAIRKRLSPASPATASRARSAEPSASGAPDAGCSSPTTSVAAAPASASASAHATSLCHSGRCIAARRVLSAAACRPRARVPVAKSAASAALGGGRHAPAPPIVERASCWHQCHSPRHEVKSADPFGHARKRKKDTALHTPRPVAPGVGRPRAPYTGDRAHCAARAAGGHPAAVRRGAWLRPWRQHGWSGCRIASTRWPTR